MNTNHTFCTNMVAVIRMSDICITAYPSTRMDLVWAKATTANVELDAEDTRKLCHLYRRALVCMESALNDFELYT